MIALRSGGVPVYVNFLSKINSCILLACAAQRLPHPEAHLPPDHQGRGEAGRINIVLAVMLGSIFGLCSI